MRKAFFVVAANIALSAATTGCIAEAVDDDGLDDAEQTASAEDALKVNIGSVLLPRKCGPKEELAGVRIENDTGHTRKVGHKWFYDGGETEYHVSTLGPFKAVVVERSDDDVKRVDIYKFSEQAKFSFERTFDKCFDL